MPRRTKIVATIGPATQNKEILRKLILAGATTFRLNFSHGDHEYHAHSIQLIRQVAFELHQPVAILQDLQGPKIRLGLFKSNAITLKTGDFFTLTSREVECSKEISYVTYKYLVEEVPEQARILIDDGKVEMLVEKVDIKNKNLYCRVIVGGILSNSKGVNFPGICLSVKPLTTKDKKDLIFGLENGVDWIALSFVRNSQDILEVREIITNAGKNIPIIAKIEKHEAIKNMKEIFNLCDGVMVARGDLGVELPPEDVPILQKQLISTANSLGIPVITATQMLDSMINNPRATRAEVSDVANAILDGTDAVMLSNETAVGKYPIQAVETMATIAERIEQEPTTIRISSERKQSVTNAISAAVSQIAEQLNAAAIISLTKTGSTARNISKFRPRIPILAVTPRTDVARQLQLVWGLETLLVLDLPSASQTFQSAINVAQENNLLEDGDLVVMTAGSIQGITGSTDLIKIQTIRAILGKGIAVGQGLASGRARITSYAKNLNDFESGDILVVAKTNAEFVEMMRKASGIITEESSLTSHAAVIGSRLGVPVILGFKDAMKNIPEGIIITIDTENGQVYSGIAKNKYS
ncbi:MAG: pyruvate kinase [Candidatus Atelocyanobacterium thalassa isolate SIO64986]|uniref:Pyruvate kinase n=1 Tax=Candidatus Atelocyanobacterium thalassa isolate SIO64986 TaxID=1527444 RepID=A0A086CGJ9_9CHRO|nr:MAG: pyruvate kinase [Candidatus Atelocyanobacterium thalassa isolate SIO64986]